MSMPLAAVPDDRHRLVLKWCERRVVLVIDHRGHRLLLTFNSNCIDQTREKGARCAPLDGPFSVCYRIRGIGNAVDAALALPLAAARPRHGYLAAAHKLTDAEGAHHGQKRVNSLLVASSFQHQGT